jgi:hypothetical protein
MKGLMKTLKTSLTGMYKWLGILAIVILALLLGNYATKYTSFDSMSNPDDGAPADDAADADEEKADVPSVDADKKTADAAPSDLLPSASNEWDVLNSVGTSTGTNPDLLDAGHHQGIDTVSQSLRNANLQVRSDPAIPVVETGPWNQTTIEVANVQVPFNIGS